MRVELEHAAGGLSIRVAVEDERANLEDLRAAAESMIATGFGEQCGRKGASLLRHVVGDESIRTSEALDEYLRREDFNDVDDRCLARCCLVVEERFRFDNSERRVRELEAKSVELRTELANLKHGE